MIDGVSQKAFIFVMTLRQRKTKDPCLECGLHRLRCICHLIPQLSLKTRLCLVIHAKELKRTTNTGRLAVRALQNSEMIIRGKSKEKMLDLSSLLVPKYQTLLFYPSDDAAELNLDLIKKISKPIQLIVPDGNWRQASKIHYRQKELQNVPRVKLSRSPQSEYFLRKETKEAGMATLQAIAYAMEALEGQGVRDQLLKVYEAKLKNTQVGRGQL